MIGNDREAVTLEGAAELFGEAFGVAVGVLQRDGGDVVGSEGGHDSRNSRKVSGKDQARQRRAHQVGERAGEQRSRPSLAIIGRWFGARPPVTAIWIAIELKLAKPHSAKVTIARLRSQAPRRRICAEVDEGDELVEHHLGAEQAAGGHRPRSTAR